MGVRTLRPIYDFVSKIGENTKLDPESKDSLPTRKRASIRSQSKKPTKVAGNPREVRPPTNEMLGEMVRTAYEDTTDTPLNKTHRQLSSSRFCAFCLGLLLQRRLFEALQPTPRHVR
jgi:hypothetical protein